MAKIFDPLHSDHQQDDVDFFLWSDASYATAAWAYAKLANLHLGLVLRYYGSYTFDIREPSAAAGAATHDVRVILVEFVRGCALRDLDPDHFSQRVRQSIIGAVIDTETAVFCRRSLPPRPVFSQCAGLWPAAAAVGYGTAEAVVPAVIACDVDRPATQPNSPRKTAYVGLGL